jgi:hypothetical protein
MTVRGEDLYSCTMNKHRQVEVWALDATSHNNIGWFRVASPLVIQLTLNLSLGSAQQYFP